MSRLNVKDLRWAVEEEPTSMITVMGENFMADEALFHVSEDMVMSVSIDREDELLIIEVDGKQRKVQIDYPALWGGKKPKVSFVRMR